jgi:hypothetical protein
VSWDINVHGNYLINIIITSCLFIEIVIFMSVQKPITFYNTPTSIVIDEKRIIWYFLILNL